MARSKLGEQQVIDSDFLSEAEHTDSLHEAYVRADGTRNFYSTASYYPFVTIENENDDSGSGRIRFIKTTSSPTNGDLLGYIQFHGTNTSGVDTQYGSYSVKISNATEGEEAGQHDIWGYLYGTNVPFLRMYGYNGSNAGQIYFNAGKNDIDFRLDGNSIDNLIRTDAENGYIGVRCFPTEPLQVFGNGIGSFSAGALSGAQTYGALSLFGSLSTSNYVICGTTAGVNAYTIFINRPSGGNISFREDNGSDQVTIKTGTGYMGLQNIDPKDPLHINKTGTLSTPAIQFSAGNASTGSTQYSCGRIVSGHTTDAYSGAYIDLQYPTAEDTFTSGLKLTTTHVSLEIGVLRLKETTTPSADSGYGKIYTKDDNELYFQDGAGTEHTVDVDGGGTSASEEALKKSFVL